MTRRTFRYAGAAQPVATVWWLIWLFLPERAGRPLHRVAVRAGRELRCWSGRLRGMCYHLARRHRVPNVSDTVFDGRVRCSLGPVEKRLDMPLVHVPAEDHIARRHGDVPSAPSARSVERAVLHTAGVRGVESYLHVAPIPAGARPSPGRTHPAASQADKRLIEDAYNAGAPAETAPSVVRAVLAFLGDVRALCVAPVRRGARPERVRRMHELVTGLATATDPLPPDHAEHAIGSVLGTQRDLVPEEDLDIAGVLPQELWDLWVGTMSD